MLNIVICALLALSLIFGILFLAGISTDRDKLGIVGMVLAPLFFIGFVITLLYKILSLF